VRRFATAEASSTLWLQEIGGGSQADLEIVIVGAAAGEPSFRHVLVLLRVASPLVLLELELAVVDVTDKQGRWWLDLN
jgi:hypothetical protein